LFFFNVFSIISAGVGQAILEKGGYVIQQECDSVIARHGYNKELRDGDVWIKILF
jgi:hypothetical protein